MEDMTIFMSTPGLTKPKVNRAHMKKGEVRTSIDLSVLVPMDNMTVSGAVSMLMGWAVFLTVLATPGEGRENEHGGLDFELNGDYLGIPDMGFTAVYGDGGFSSARIDTCRRWTSDENGNIKTTTITVDNPEFKELFSIPGITLGEIAQLWATSDNKFPPSRKVVEAELDETNGWRRKE